MGTPSQAGSPPADEPDKAIIEDMWLGVTVASQRQPAGRVLVSPGAPRGFAHPEPGSLHTQIPVLYTHTLLG